MIRSKDAQGTAWHDAWARSKTILTRHGRWIIQGPVGQFFCYVLRRFIGDSGPQAASGLSYASLLALVPLLAIALAIVSAFPTFRGVEERLLELLFRDALPPMEAEAGERIRDFIRNAKQLTGPGIAGLSVTAILLLSNINGAFNTIWRVNEPRPLALRVLVYWALMTLGPLLLAVSVSASGLVFGVSGVETVAGWARWLVPPWLVSIIVGSLGFGALYFVVPNRGVEIRHALAGGFVTAILFEGLKTGFAVYLAAVPGYQAVYGALAALPIFLIWLYLSWATVLIGAEVVAALPEWRAYRVRAGAGWPGERLVLALSLLGRLRTAQRGRTAPTRKMLVKDLPATPGEIDAVLAPLRRAGICARTSQGRWVLAADLRGISLGELMVALGLAMSPGPGWPEAAVRPVRALESAIGDLIVRDLDALLARDFQETAGPAALAD